MNPPFVFISYSHDSKDHAEKILRLSDKLRQDGIDAMIDQYETFPAEGWPRWMENNIDRADFVLMICTETYYRRVMGREEKGVGLGVTWEGNIIYNRLYRDGTINKKYIPILFENCTLSNIPNPLQGYSYFHVDTDEGYEDLYRLLTDQPKHQKPGLGKLKKLNELSKKTRKTDFNIPFKKLDIGYLDELVGRKDALWWLEERLLEGETNTVALASIHGAGGMGKTFLTHVFADLHKDEVAFLPVYLGETKPLDAGIQLLSRMNVDTSRIDSADALASAMDSFYAAGKGIVIFDDVRSDDIEVLLPNTTNWRVLLTTRDKKIARKICGERDVKELDVLSIPESIELYKKVLCGKYTVSRQADYEKLADYLSCRPYSIRLSAGYMLDAFDPCPRALLKKLKEGEIPARDDPFSLHRLGKLLESCLEQLEGKSPYARKLLDYIAVCADEGISLSRFIQWQSQSLASPVVEDGLETARSLGLIIIGKIASDSLSEGEARYNIRLHTDLHAIIRKQDLKSECASLMEYLVKALVERAFGPALDETLQKHVYSLAWLFRLSHELIAELYEKFWNHLYYTGRLQWAYELVESCLSYLDENIDRYEYGRVIGNQALILQDWGRLDEAMELHKKEEAIFIELGLKNELQICYCNQALILYFWGRLDEAMELNKKQEVIRIELGNKNILQICYGNQALILRDWGRLDEAIGLYKKQEALCIELGNKAGLGISYGNQALILQDWGRLEEAMELNKKQEAICIELGNKNNLQICYGNQALILKDWGKQKEADELLRKQKEIQEQLKATQKAKDR